jgi:hypothetical protein
MLERNMLVRISFLIALLGFSSYATAIPQCSTDAILQAGKLLAFHSDNDARISIDEKVKQLPSIRNPASKKQRFIALEVWGYIYKGQYRMRLIYYPLGSGCVLMGQEILEHAQL